MKYLIKCMNFISPTFYNKQMLYALWFYQTIFCFIATIVTIVILQGIQIHEKYMLTKQLRKMETYIAQKKHQRSFLDEMHKEKELLIKPQKKINIYAQRLQEQQGLFTHLQQYLQTEHIITSIKMGKNACEIIGICPSTRHIYDICSRLQQHPLLAHAHVISMHYIQDGQVQYRIKS